MDTALNIAQYILNKCTVENKMISNLQLQKIMYIIQREFLQNFHIRAIDDFFEAWKYGPVIPEIYSMYCGSGANKINRLYNIHELNFTNVEMEYIDAIINKKRVVSAWDLVSETHKKGGAWDQTFNNGFGNGEIIANDLIERVG